MKLKAIVRTPFLALLSVMVLGTACDGDEGNPNAGQNFEFPSVSAEACAEEREALEAQVEGEAKLVDDADQMTGLATAGYGSYLNGGYYRDDLDSHPGCEPRSSYDAPVGVFSTFLGNTASVVPGEPIDLPGYSCAGKQYDDSNVDPEKPIIILVHGNSDSPDAWEDYLDSTAGTTADTGNFTYQVDSSARSQLASSLIEDGYRVFASDMRIDLAGLDDVSGSNAGLNVDHGWATPILQSLIKAVLTEYPDNQISLVGHSLGVTIIRDSLRRLWIDHRDNGEINPFPRVDDIIMGSGANHGVSDIVTNCDEGVETARSADAGIMNKTVVCELGSLDDHVPTYFNRRLNGPSDVHALPCSDAFSAYGEDDQCDGNQIEYSVIVMEDQSEGDYKDEFVNETSANFNYSECYADITNSLDDVDTSHYFFNGAFAAHFGAVRSEASLTSILTELGD